MIRFFSIVFIFAFSFYNVNTCNAQRKNPKKAKFSSVSKKNSNSGKGKVKQGSRVFEGALLYRSYEHHSAVVRKFSQGRAYNGERTIRVTLRGNSAHIVDESMHLHTIINANANTVFVYSDLTNEGISAGKDFIHTYLSMQDPDYNTPEMPKSSTLAIENQKTTYKGDLCNILKGTVSIGKNAETDAELWYSNNLLANKAYKYFLYGLPPKGIVRRGIYNNVGRIPLLGKAQTITALELVALKEYRVSDSEMKPPSTIRLERMEKSSQLTDLYKANTKELKRQKIYPKISKRKEIKHLLNNQWDFVDDWLDKDFVLKDNNITWAKVGENLFNNINNIVSTFKEGNDDISEDNLTDEQKKLYKKYKKDYDYWLKELKKYINETQKHSSISANSESTGLRTLKTKLREIREECKKNTGKSISPSSFESYHGKTRDIKRF